MVEPTPIETGTLSLRRVELDRRTDCARVAACVTYANRRKWLGFTCAYCAVRETSKAAVRMRDGDGQGQGQGQ